MRTVSIFMNSRNQAIRIPKDMEFRGVVELEISKEGETLLLRPARPSWTSLNSELQPDPEFLTDREDVIEEGRFDWMSK